MTTVMEVEFDWREYLAQFDERLLLDPEGRRVLTRLDPLLFAIVYFRSALSSKETGDEISFSQFHLDLCERAKQWARQDLGFGELREAWVAPRGSGKSTWLFKILPTWALAHGHRRYVAAFADSAYQAQQHLSSLKREFDWQVNQYLYRDYPELCKPMTRRGQNVSDNQSLYIAKSGAVFSAKGIDSSILGANIANQRPDLILFDDVEPDASNYSLYQKEKRLLTITQAVFNMNPNAVVEFAGTTTMHGSVMHDLVRSVVDPEEGVADWVRDENVETHYYPAIIGDADGRERSLWPQRWSMEDLERIRHTRAFRMDYMNLPAGTDGGFWTPSDFRYDELTSVTRRILSVDPAVTTKAGSDFTGLAIVGYDPMVGECVVEMAQGVKLGPAELRERILTILEANPTIKAVLIETNQGGDTWASVLSPLPVKILPIHQHEPKPIRVARVLDYYQSGWVSHAERLAAFEEQAMAYPHVTNDDILDAVCSGVHFFLKDRKKTFGARRRPSTQSYI
jgi:phage terminase large subunit-like protein